MQINALLPVITNAGVNAFLAHSGNDKVKISKIALGDGNGAGYVPDPTAPNPALANQLESFLLSGGVANDQNNVLHLNVVGNLNLPDTVEVKTLAGESGPWLTDSQWNQQQKLIASDVQENDLFGLSVSISGDWAIVGAYREDSGGTNAGSAYVFHWDVDEQKWKQQQKLQASDTQADDQFGRSVVISGDRAIVGAYREDPDGISDAGSAYVFHWNGSQWVEEQKLQARDAQARDAFGWSVSISGDHAIVGAVVEDPDGKSNAGSTYIFSFGELTIKGVFHD